MHLPLLARRRLSVYPRAMGVGVLGTSTAHEANESTPVPRRRIPRGAAAAEFALVAPMFIALLIGLFVFGMMLVARFQIHSIAVATVRSCVALQNTGDSVASYQQCLNTRFQYILQQTSNPCTNNPTLDAPIPQMLSQTGALNGSSQKIYLLKLGVQCDYSIGAIQALMPSSAAKITFNVSSAMPFVKG